MSSRTIFTEIFRTGYPHLDQPWSANAQQEPKYGLAMMFPKVNALPAHINASVTTGVDNIFQALNEVCMEEWGVDFATAPQVRGVQFPPQWKDGDVDFKKDERGNLTQEVNPSSVGMWILGVKSKDPVGIVDHTGNNELLPNAVYAGCWCRAEIEISAYTNKANSSIISIQLLNVQKCYDDESLGGATPRRAATTAFGGMAVQGSNCQVGAGQVGMGAVPGQAPQGQAPQGQAPQGMSGQMPQGMPPQAAPQGMPPQAAPQGMPGQMPQGMPGQTPAVANPYLNPQ